MAEIATRFAEAFARHQAGDLGTAETLYREVLKAEQEHSEALYLLGSLRAQCRDFAAAAVLLERAVTLRPDQVRYVNNLGVALKETERFAEARTAYERALALVPDYPEALNNLGDLCKAEGRNEEAIDWFRRAIQANPNYAEAHNNLGMTLREAHLPGTNNAGHEADSAEHFQQVERHFRDAVAARPRYAEAHNNLGAILRLQARLDDAEGSIQEAIRLKPDLASAHNNLGLVFHQQRRYEEAEACFRHALALEPDYGDAHLHLGLSLQALEHYDQAQEAFQKALDIDPQRSDARFNQSLLLLMRGEMEAGWEGYEWRLQAPTSPQRVYTQPQWDGSPLNGRTLLVHAEQGFGDTFQFVRYLPLIPKHGGKVLFECQPGTRELLQRCQGFDQIIERPLTNRTQADVPHDVQIPLMSLARLFPHPAEEPPAPEPYIHADPERVALWRDRLAEAEAITPGHRPTHLKVGLVWAGNPKHGNDHNRSAALADLAPLARVPGVTLYSLQKGPAEEQIAQSPAEMTLIALGGALDDHADTAAVLMNLDLLIAVDTSTAHLAGALGRPVWLLTPCVPDWRWMLEREDSPWYPSVRLFRQPVLKDWASVVTRMAAELEQQVVAATLKRIEAAEALFADGRMAEAKETLLALSSSDTPHPRALNDLAILYWKEGATAETLACFMRALQAAPADQTIRANCMAVVQTIEAEEERRQQSLRKGLRVLTPLEIEEMHAIDWWHRIPIGLTEDGQILFTPGHCVHGPDGTDYATTRFGLPLDMTGATVLDIGGWDGYFAFEAEKRGAAEILVADNFPQEGRLFGTPAGLAFATRILGSKVQFLASSVYELPTVLQDRTFDYVFFFGVLYHIEEPLTALRIVHALTSGTALIETARYESPVDAEPLWALRPGFDTDPTNLWYPNIAGLTDACHHVGFADTGLIFDMETRCTVRAVRNTPHGEK